MRTVFLIPPLLLWLLAVPAQAALEISIQGGQTRPVPIAVVPFDSSAVRGSDTDLAEVIANDLSRSGLFYSLPRGDMLERPTTMQEIDFGNWRALGVEYLIIGRVVPGSLGNWVVEFQLMDVYRAEQSMAQDVPTSRFGARKAAHHVSDLIYQKLTGHRGVSNTQIAYVTAEGPVSARKFKLLIADTDGFNPRELVASNDPIMSPAWSHDARQMAYVAFNQGKAAIYLQTIATGRVRKLTDDPGINGAPAWSPDSRKIALTLSKDGNPEIYVVDARTGAQTRITRNTAIDTEPSWSPDGSQLLFTSDRGGRAQLYTVPAAGGNAERLSFEGISNARGSWSPDGKTIALVHQTSEGYQIAVMDAGSRSITALSAGPLDESPSFAPNGVVIIYATKGKFGSELATVTVDTQARQELRQRGEVREPAWSPFFD